MDVAEVVLATAAAESSGLFYYLHYAEEIATTVDAVAAAAEIISISSEMVKMVAAVSFGLFFCSPAVADAICRKYLFQ